MTRTPIFPAALTGLTLVGLAGCAVGPDFHRPEAPTAGYSRDALPPTTATKAAGGEAQRFLPGQTVAGDWWTLFQSPALNQLMAEALKNSPTLEAAEATWRQAQETLRAQRGTLLPAVDGSVNTSRQKSSFNGAPIPAYSLTTASVSVAYTADIFGTRRRLETVTAQAERVRYQKEAVYLTLTSNIVAAAIQHASLRAQVQATQSILSLQGEQLGVLRKQLELGGVAEADVLTQQTALAQSRAQLPALQKQLTQSRNLLLALAGRFPDNDAGVDFDLDAFKLPTELPVSLPSELVAQRPDIRMAETDLHVATAGIGVAIANMLPQFTLRASTGTTANDIGDLFGPGTGIWTLAAGLTQPIFHGGELLHQKRAAVAAYDAASAQYRDIVVNAFRNVADTLRALEADADALNAQVEAERSAANSLTIAQNRYQSGGSTFLILLDAQRTYQQARVALVQAQASRYADTAALFVALGGGWWNRPENATDAP